MPLIFTRRFIVVFILGFSSGVPLAMVTSTLQAWFAKTGMSVYATGMLSLLGLPYLYRFIWSPVLDRFSLSKSFGRRKSWMLLMQIFLCVGFNLMAWFSPQTSPITLAVLGFILASVSATQDSVIDAYRVECLNSEEFGLGASVASLGYRLAMLISGGLSLVLAENYGWEVVYRVMGFVMVIGMLASIFAEERKVLENTDNSFAHIFTDPIKDLLSRPKILTFCLFVLFFKLGESFTTTTSGVVMPFLIQGVGFSLSTIAYVNKILGVLAIIFGGILGGIILLRYSLYHALLAFGLLQSLTNSLFIVLAIVGKNTILLSAAVMSDNFAAGLGTTAIVALFMSYVDCRYTATQFSILVAFASIPRVFSGPIGAFFQIHLGWVGMFQAGFLLSFVFIPFLLMLASDPCFANKKNSDDETCAVGS
ncbi:MAG: MFS transporter [Legionellales bacterium RIFCSPHIGHO2_12_FULL_35_11]|nr:MAG: MFS transporter [Legionellales bacterium RIFCSPHIGHO2_12_FULL_35_11]